MLAGCLLGWARCRCCPTQAQRSAPAGNVRGACPLAAAVHDRRLRSWRGRLGDLAGWRCRSVPARRAGWWGRWGRRPNASAPAAKCGQPEKEGADVTEATEEGSSTRHNGDNEEAEETKENLAREVGRLPPAGRRRRNRAEIRLACVAKIVGSAPQIAVSSRVEPIWLWGSESVPPANRALRITRTTSSGNPTGRSPSTSW